MSKPANSKRRDPWEISEPPRLATKARVARIIGTFAGALTIAAIVAAAILLIFDARPFPSSLFDHSPLSAMPLLLAGASYVVLQAMLRPRPMELIRRLMLGGAFLLWGIVQLMRAGALATDLGDVVITLYVIDLGLMVQAELQRR